jgi:hypothetical protein
MVATGEGFNLPMFLHSVLITGATLIKTRDGTNQSAEKYTELFSVAADNFEHIYKTFKDSDYRITTLENEYDVMNNEIGSLTDRTDELEDTVSKINSCECDKEWMHFMKQNFQQGLFNDDIVVNGTIDMRGNVIERIGNIKVPEAPFTIEAPKLHVASGVVEAMNIPANLNFIHDSRKEDLTGPNSVIDYNTYGVWQQACDLDVFGSVDVDNRLRINTLDENKRNIVKTVDVGATLDDLDYRVREIEQGGGGGGGDGYWKKNTARMERLPEHITLENFDFNKYAETISFKKISDDYSLIYFPNLVSIDLDYDRYQFITISGLANENFYITTKDRKIKLPLVNSFSLNEVFEYTCDVHDVGILWRNKQPVGHQSGVEFSVGNGYARFDAEVYKGTEEEPTTLYLQEFDSTGKLIIETTFTLTHTVSTHAGGGIE